MPYPRLDDDGRRVVLDVHGVPVDEALHLVRKVAREASRLGRSTLTVVHGASTSDVRYANRTIKHAVEAEVAAGALPEVVSSWSAGGALLLGLRLSETPNEKRRLSLRDVMAGPR